MKPFFTPFKIKNLTKIINFIIKITTFLFPKKKPGKTPRAFLTSTKRY
tara:strand:+ start:251 stop:394 length:144 start_codon:yes stop_codon:yes gene_type:complete